MYLKALLKYIFQGGHRADNSQGYISFSCYLKQGEGVKLRVTFISDTLSWCSQNPLSFPKANILY